MINVFSTNYHYAVNKRHNVLGVFAPGTLSEISAVKLINYIPYEGLLLIVDVVLPLFYFSACSQFIPE